MSTVNQALAEHEKAQAQPDPEPDPGESKQPLEEAKAEKNPTVYVVLVGREQGDETFWVEVTRKEAQSSGVAKRAALNEVPVLKEALEAGEAFPLVAVPERSWAPTTAQIERTERLKLG